MTGKQEQKKAELIETLKCQKLGAEELQKTEEAIRKFETACLSSKSLRYILLGEKPKRNNVEVKDSDRLFSRSSVSIIPGKLYTLHIPVKRHSMTDP